MIGYFEKNRETQKKRTIASCSSVLFFSLSGLKCDHALDRAASVSTSERSCSWRVNIQSSQACSPMYYYLFPTHLTHARLFEKPVASTAWRSPPWIRASVLSSNTVQQCEHSNLHPCFSTMCSVSMCWRESMRGLSLGAYAVALFV